MGSTDIFKKPFDDGTKTKLEIYKNYLKEWLPVFLAKKEIIWKNIQIFDFCAGQGKDVEGTLGSPLITLQELNNWSENILRNKLAVKVILNEPEINLFDFLKPLVSEFTKPEIYNTDLFNEDFQIVFNRYYDSMQNSANLLFIDQSGVKLITNEVFNKIISLKQTDFLFFISSSFIKRFGDSEEFTKYLKLNKTDIENISYYHIHKAVLEYYRSLIPITKEYYLAPFSIKKGSNIYGLIFGTNHTLGMEKFLSVCWRIDKQRGEANFDIDKENIIPERPTLFDDYNIPNKRQLFEKELKENILNKKLQSDIDIYLFTLNSGFLFKDTNKVLSDLKNKIQFDFKLITSNIHKIRSPSPIKIK